MRLDLSRLTLFDYEVLLREGLLLEADRRRVEECVGCDWDYNLWALPLSSLADLEGGRLPAVLEAEIRADGPLTVMLPRVLYVRNFFQTLLEMLEKIHLAPLPEDAPFLRRLPEMKGIERPLIEVRAYFGLSSFDAAAAVPLGDWFLVRKDLYSTAYLERMRYERQKRQYKRKHKR